MGQEEMTGKCFRICLPSHTYRYFCQLYVSENLLNGRMLLKNLISAEIFYYKYVSCNEKLIF